MGEMYQPPNLQPVADNPLQVKELMNMVGAVQAQPMLAIPEDSKILMTHIGVMQQFRPQKTSTEQLKDVHHTLNKAEAEGLKKFKITVQSIQLNHKQPQAIVKRIQINLLHLQQEPAPRLMADPKGW